MALIGISNWRYRLFILSFIRLSPFTCMGPLNISFSPAHYIFLEIAFPPIHIYTGRNEEKIWGSLHEYLISLLFTILPTLFFTPLSYNMKVLVCRKDTWM